MLSRIGRFLRRHARSFGLSGGAKVGSAEFCWE
jgi:hypothetical protein